MFLVGLLLIVLGALAIVLGVTGLSGQDSTLLGADLGTRQIFLLGVAASAAIVVGLLALQFAARRSLRRRRERRQLTELSEKLDAVEADRHDDGHFDDRGTHRAD